MIKYIILFFCIFLVSCTDSVRTRTYDLVDSYSDLESDPLRIAMKKKIREFLCLADYCNKTDLNKFVLNGRYLTIKVIEGDEAKIEKLLQSTLCKQVPLTRCKECNTSIIDSTKLNE